MLERRSALSNIDAIDTPHFSMREDSTFRLLELAAPSKESERILGGLPSQGGMAVEHHGRTLMRVGTDKFWIVGSPDEDVAENLRATAFITPLHSSRTRIMIAGQAVRDVLARSSVLDFQPAAFKEGMFAQTGIHHTPVLVHCLAHHAFHIYAMRTFSVSVWDWLADAAAGLKGA
jgi:methylglutamate dehydrogenase subunit D